MVRHSLILIALLFAFFSGLSQNTAFDEEIDSLLTQTNHLPDSIRIASLLNGATKFRFHPNTKPLLLEAMQMTKRIGEGYGLATTAFHYGNFHLFSGDLDSALYYLHQAQTFDFHGKEPFLEPAIYISIGGAYSKKGAIPKAIEQILIGKRIYEKIDTATLNPQEKYKLAGQISVVNNTLANSYLRIENFDEANRYYDEAFEALMSMDAFSDAGVALSNKADVLLKQSKYAEALQLLEAGRKLKVKGNSNRRSIGFSDLNIGMAYVGLGRLDDAMQKYNTTLQLFEEEGFRIGSMYVLVERGLLYTELNQWENALNDCETGKILAIQNSEIEYQSKACKCLYTAYEKLKNYPLALENFQQYTVLKDSIFNEKNIKKLTQLEMQYAFDKEQELQAVDLAAQKKQQKLIVNALILLLFLSGIIAFSVYRGFLIKKKAEKALQHKNEIISKALNEKEMLLKEIHHRVKNNLQVVSSLLSLQSRQLQDTGAQEALQESRNRVQSMALIHENLYQENNLVGVNTKDYFEKLVNSLLNNYNIDANKIQLTSDIDDVQLDVDVLIPIGLILNELISNALKYAFNDGADGKIHVTLKNETKHFLLMVSDNGIGLPENFEIAKSKTLGFKLIKSFSDKLKATLSILTEQGTTVKLIIPKEAIKFNL
jgi:two-component sensor histidine kinase